MEKREKKNVFSWLGYMWREKPLVSTGMVLVLLIILQTIYLGFDFASFGDWFDKWLRNWINIFLNNSYVGIIALGMTFVILSGGIDLAVGSTLVAIGAMIMVLMDTGDSGLLLRMGITGIPAICVAILIGMIAGTLLGGVNGFLITRGRIPPFIATLGAMKILRSVTQHFMQSYPRIKLPSEFLNISGVLVGGHRLLPIIYWIAIALVLHVVSRHTAFGRHVYAVGSNEKATRLSGINADRVKRGVYALMGLVISIATIIQVSRIGSMDYASTGSGYEMDAIAAVIVGGTSMSGGRGSVMGTVIGMLIIAVMNNLLNLIGVPPFLREAFKGAIVIAAVLLQRKERAA